jgi:hypothetical protein
LADTIVPERVSRDEAGRFLPGHPFFGHNELARKQLAKRTAIIDATTAEQALEVMEALRARALSMQKGAAQAAAVWLQYAVGAPDKILNKDDAAKTFDVVNLNKPPSELTAEQRRARLQFLMAEQAKAKEAP